jgi:hypothetical protein
MDPTDPNQPPQLPRAFADAIAAAHLGAAPPSSASAAPTSTNKRRGNVLFHTPAASNKRFAAATPSSPAPLSTPVSSAGTRTPASVLSTVSNQSDCINDSFFKWARLFFIESCIIDATDDFIFTPFKAHFTNQLN